MSIVKTELIKLKEALSKIKEAQLTGPFKGQAQEDEFFMEFSGIMLAIDHLHRLSRLPIHPNNTEYNQAVYSAMIAGIKQVSMRLVGPNGDYTLTERDTIRHPGDCRIWGTERFSGKQEDPRYLAVKKAVQMAVVNCRSALASQLTQETKIKQEQQFQTRPLITLEEQFQIIIDQISYLSTRASLAPITGDKNYDFTDQQIVLLEQQRRRMREFYSQINSESFKRAKITLETIKKLVRDNPAAVSSPLVAEAVELRKIIGDATANAGKVLYGLNAAFSNGEAAGKYQTRFENFWKVTFDFISQQCAYNHTKQPWDDTPHWQEVPIYPDLTPPLALKQGAPMLSAFAAASSSASSSEPPVVKQEQQKLKP